MKQLAGWSITIMIPTKDNATMRAVMMQCAATNVSFLSLGDFTSCCRGDTIGYGESCDDIMLF